MLTLHNHKMVACHHTTLSLVEWGCSLGTRLQLVKKNNYFLNDAQQKLIATFTGLSYHHIGRLHIQMSKRGTGSVKKNNSLAKLEKDVVLVAQ